MNYTENKITGIKIAYIGGGSKGWAWSLMGDLAVEPKLSGTVSLYDIDFEAAYDNQTIGNQLSGREDVKGKWHYEVAENLRDALTGADFVILSILPGTFNEMAFDLELPEQYGIYQSVGDTVGPGGLLRALRTIPMYVEFATKIKEFAPEAWVINYTNPMSLCVRTLYEVFPAIKAFGCCHEVFETQNLLITILKNEKGLEGVTRDEIRINVLGINHFTWVDRASYHEFDLFPLYRHFVDRYYETGFEDTSAGNWLNKYFLSAHRVKFDLFKRYGLIAAAGDRHLVEFMPPWYLKDPETAHSWKFHLTPVDWRVRNRRDLVLKSKRLVNGEESFELKRSGEEGIRQIKALLGLGDFLTNVNLPNLGQTKGIPFGAIVETNAVFSRNNIRPVLAGGLPPEIQNLTMRHVLNQETVLKAALYRDKEMAFRAFINDPLVTIDINQARELFTKMLVNTKNYLPEWEL